MELPLPSPSATEDSVDTFAMDLSNSIKNGYLFMQDPIDKVRAHCGKGRRICVCVVKVVTYSPLHMPVTPHWKVL